MTTFFLLVELLRNGDGRVPKKKKQSILAECLFIENAKQVAKNEEKRRRSR